MGNILQQKITYKSKIARFSTVVIGILTALKRGLNALKRKENTAHPVLTWF